MPSSEARILANQKNALLSTGPRTAEGKAASRANSYKHGLTGDGIVMPEEDAAEVQRLATALRTELAAPGEAGAVLAERMALLAVRMNRSARHECAASSERIRQALDEFEPPEGADEETARKLRSEAGHRAWFDTSKPSCLARKYEAAAERGFFRALAEIRLLKKGQSSSTIESDLAAEDQRSMTRMGSFLQTDKPTRSSAAPASSKPLPSPSQPVPVPSIAPSAPFDPFAGSHFDIPISIGLRR
jgi:hypothetical protein